MNWTAVIDKLKVDSSRVLDRIKEDDDDSTTTAFITTSLVFRGLAAALEEGIEADASN